MREAQRDFEHCDGKVSLKPPQGRVSMSLKCGLHWREAPKTWEQEGIATIDGVGRWLLLRPTKRWPSRGVSFHGWDADTPCAFSVGWSGPDRTKHADTLKSFGLEVLRRLTVEDVAQPVAGLLVARIDDTGERARAALESFGDKLEALNAVAPLSPGYPRVARSEEFAGLPPGRHFLLLAVCDGQRAGYLAPTLSALFPRAEPPPKIGQDTRVYYVPSAGLSPACPDTLSASMDGNGIASRQQILPDGRTLSVISTADNDAAPGEVHHRGAALLFAADNTTVLDTLTFELKRPVDGSYPGLALPETQKTHGRCRGGAGEGFHAYTCEVRYADHQCSGMQVKETILRTFRATDDDRLEVKISQQRRPGSMCTTPH